MKGWQVEEVSGSAGDLHGWELPERAVRCVRVSMVERPALVLGSTQRDDIVDRRAAARAGVEVVRRRSGGGAVLLEPDAHVWIDVAIPAGDGLWTDDVSRSFHWLGEVWVGALDSVAVRGATLHTAAMCHTKLSRLICFAGVGPGEVSLDGAKAVGISQRRSRAGARFQSLVLGGWNPELLVALLAPGLEAYGPGWREEVDRIQVATVDVDHESLVQAFLDGLAQL
jgi:lipoate---protein ligase